MSRFPSAVLSHGHWLVPCAVQERMIALILLVGVVAFLQWPAEAQATPKLTSFGCSQAQLNSPEAQNCMRKQESDILKGYTNIHNLVCNGGKMQCCIIGTGSIRGQCSPVRSLKGSVTEPKLDGAVQQP